ncbi:bisanhydrobacterioruberin hydratase [Halogeometricum borinquense]|uniref:Carotene biosynthesis associated membrane protein n=1 Tax=Halogeometricum borinquense (strain ATCC 700274 / DSM 11551 / JCM 10706 / KCTC 4070 / PR3) TaxID=469382 RepID=E4NQ97_HALBP|nr:bisanhydrobacterioruberin hydratase [Halogeometricum borinquense]ADQ66659.1 carotene biosynthesis associated membrane protein [Halogeometricum borinquense DSM 11551]
MVEADVALANRLPTTREEWEYRLDRLVRENRFTISVFFPLNGIVLLLASAEGWLSGTVLAPLAFNGLFILFGTFVMRSPLLVGVLPHTTRRGATGVGLLTLYAYLIEYTGVHTGFPYGQFAYGVALGPTVGGIPLGLPVFFVPLVMNAYLLCLLLLGDRAEHTVIRLCTVIIAVLAMDVVLDPGAVALGFWAYTPPGAFYGVPLSNYAGWVLSATVAVILLDWGYDQHILLTRLSECEFMLDDLVSFVILWGGLNAWFGNWLPVAVAALFGLGLLKTERFDSRVFRFSQRKRSGKNSSE